ncbi:MAG: phage tail assembly chaperone [Cypionkella sp.]
MDFAGLMRAALCPPWQGGLGLTPQVFWGLTPQELRLMLGRDTAPHTMTAARLGALMAQYPDLEKGA